MLNPTLSGFFAVFLMMQAPFLNDMLQSQKKKKNAVQNTRQSGITCSVTSFAQLQSIR